MSNDQQTINLSDVIRRGYLHMGRPEDFLSYKIRDIFGEITSERGVADHNGMAQDVKMMIRQTDREEFFRQISLVTLEFAGRGITNEQA